MNKLLSKHFFVKYKYYFLLLLGVVLLLLNVYQSHVLNYSIHDSYTQTSINKINSNLDDICHEWINTDNDSLFLDNIWSIPIAEDCRKNGISFFLYKDSTLLYWSNQLAGNMGEFLTDMPGSRLDTINHRLLSFLKYEDANDSLNAKTAYVIMYIKNVKTEELNPALFIDDNIIIFTDSTQFEGIVKPIKLYHGDNEFWVNYGEGARPYNFIMVMIGWLGVFIMLISIVMLFNHITDKHNVIHNIVLFFIIIFFARWGINIFQILDVNSLLLYHVYVNLGDSIIVFYDLFVDMVFMSAFIIFIFKIKYRLRYKLKRLSKLPKYLFMGFCVLVVSILLLYYNYQFYTLIIDLRSPFMGRTGMSVIIDLMFCFVSVGILASMIIVISVVNKVCFTRRQNFIMDSAEILIMIIVVMLLWDKLTYAWLFILAWKIVSVFLFSIINNNYENKLVAINKIFLFILYNSFLFGYVINTQSMIISNIFTEHVATTLDVDKLNIENYDDNLYVDYQYAILDDCGWRIRANNDINIEDIYSVIRLEQDTIIEDFRYTHIVKFFDNKESVIIVSFRNINFYDFLVVYSMMFFIAYFILFFVYKYVFNVYVVKDYVGGFKLFRLNLSLVILIVSLFVLFAFMIFSVSKESMATQNRILINNRMQSLNSSFVSFVNNNPGRTDYLEAWNNQVVSDMSLNINLYYLNGSRVPRYNDVDVFVSTKMMNEAYYNMSYGGMSYFYKELSNYNGNEYIVASSVLRVDGVDYGYLTVAEQNFLRKRNHNLLIIELINILIVIVFFILLLSLIFYLRVTSPLNRIIDALKNINKLEKIEIRDNYNNDDIYELVSQYNRMIDFVLDSYKRIAKSERESAWKEMARQVAHEIKNPLTPMRLKVQILQAAIDRGDENIEQRTKDTLALLLSQIDALSKIAGEFSRFAKMEDSQEEVYDICQQLKEVEELYTDNKEGVDFRLQLPSNDCPIMICADKVKMRRVFINLCKNALEAVDAKGDSDGKVVIYVKSDHTKVYVAVSDTGIGVPAHMQARMFQPNFTTKSGGSGLGLAVSAKIVNDLGGVIRLNSIPGHGATFTVEIPLSSCRIDMRD